MLLTFDYREISAGKSWVGEYLWFYLFQKSSKFNIIRDRLLILDLFNDSGSLLMLMVDPANSVFP